MKKKTSLVFLFFFAAAVTTGQHQPINRIGFSADSLVVYNVQVAGSDRVFSASRPLVSFELNYHVTNAEKAMSAGLLRVNVLEVKADDKKFSLLLRFTNLTNDSMRLSNVVPFGITAGDVYITGKGDHELSRTHLFIPGKTPVNVIVPDNAWELGFCSFSLPGNSRLLALSRRDRNSIHKGERHRFETILYPGGAIDYRLYIEICDGDWRQALIREFRDNMLYDIGQFDNRLYERRDLQWIRSAYVITMMMNWDKFFYDDADHSFHINDFLARGKKLYGGDDAIVLWPTWPTLGLDQRNQFDMYRDLPGGTAKLRSMAADWRKKGTRLFVAYNPWDESTRSEDHFEGISKLIRATTADGVVLDTKGESSGELQQAADRVRPGVVMYSEGMAVPADMPGIVSGRVHNALYYPPMLNLNKLIKPGFSIFRVTEINKEPVRREFAVAFFNGYGTEINIMGPGQPEWVDEQYKYLGRTSMILRQNSDNFVVGEYTPLLETNADSIWVNKWAHGSKIIYTIYSLIPEGFKGNLFEVEHGSGFHYVDLWWHRLLQPTLKDGHTLVEVQTNAFNKSDLGTNNESEVDCIARLPKMIYSHLIGDECSLHIEGAGNADTLMVWAGNPGYDKIPVILKPVDQGIMLHKYFGRFEGKFVIQLFRNGQLLDETIEEILPGTARRISEAETSAIAGLTPIGMVKIPSGNFHFSVTSGDDFIAYPKQGVDSTFQMHSYYMDIHPVTNAEFSEFIHASNYHPADTAHFLQHWQHGRIPAGMERFPVIYISYEDAKAYAKWAGKRLPTEIEWQYAAQTPSLNEWPWIQSKPVIRKNEVVTNTLTVTHIEGIDSNRCNLGDGKLYETGKYPLGANPYGLLDLSGSVWQLTNDLYMSGSYRYIMMKGGSYFKPSGSWWYVQGGPRELHYRQYLLRVSEGFERNATVGFRCVKDSK